MSDGIVGDISSWLFGGNTNPANAAQPYLNQIPGMLQGAYNPYIQAGMGPYGMGAFPGLMQGYGAMTNPNFINNMGKDFHQSPGYQFQVNQALGAANRAAAAGGSLGTPQEQQQIAGVTSGLANQDYYNWLNHAMGAYTTGLGGETGIASNLYNTGFNASNQMAQDLAQNAMSQANLAYAGQANQNEMNQGLFGAGLGFLGNFLGGSGSEGGMGGSAGSSYGMPSLGWLGKLANFF